MAIHSSIPAWEIPWTEEPGGLQFMGSQRVGHNLVTNTRTHTHTHTYTHTDSLWERSFWVEQAWKIELLSGD